MDSNRLARTSTILGLAFASAVAIAQADVVPGRVLIRFAPGTQARSADAMLSQESASTARTMRGVDIRVLTVAPGSERRIAARLARQAGVQFASVDRAMAPSATPNDPMFASQWHHAKIGTNNAWNAVIGNSNVIIAILDTGCDPTHPDLMGKYVAGWNTYDNNSNFADVYGHGTAVAGCAAASTNNALGIAGVGWNCQLMPIRISDTAGYGYSSTVSAGLVYAADHGARVANISYAFSDDPSVLSAAQYFQSKGGVVTMSAGNSGMQELVPASPNVLTVSATDSADNLASWSTTGTMVDLAAPGVNITTTNRGGGYGGWSGTSFSAPITAGVAALVISANPSLTAGQIQDAMTQTALERGAAGWDVQYGWGRVDANAAVNRALSLVGYVDVIAPSVSFLSPSDGATVSGTATVEAAATDNVGVASVSFYLDGALVATDTAAPFAYSWNTLNSANGAHNLRTEARDAAANLSSAQISVNVSNTVDVTAPAVAIVSPSSGYKVGNSFSVSASATDNVGVAKVELWIDGVLKATDSSAPYSFSVNSRKWKPGPHSLAAKAYDARSNVGTSATVSVTK